MWTVSVEHLLGSRFDIWKPRRDFEAGIFCVETNHYFSRNNSDAVKYTYSFVCCDFGYPPREQHLFYLVEAFPIDVSKVNGLMRQIGDAFLPILRNLNIQRIALINGLAPDYSFDPGNSSHVILHGKLVNINCRPQPQQRIDELGDYLGLPIIPDEEFLKKLIGEDTAPYVGWYI